MRLIFGYHDMPAAVTATPSIETELKIAIANVTLQTDALKTDFTAVLAGPKSALWMHTPVAIASGGLPSQLFDTHLHQVGNPVLPAPDHNSI